MTMQAERLPDKILDFCDLVKAEHMDAGLPFWRHLALRYQQRGLGEIPELFNRDQGVDYSTGTVAAFIDYGRWVIQCATCRSGVIACYHAPFFMCVACGNAGNGGNWLTVDFPDDRQAIEDLLMLTPGFRTNAPDRSWRPPVAIRGLANVVAH